MIRITVDDEILRRHANPVSVARGRAYQKAGAVVGLSFVSPHLLGDVERRRDHLYRVTIRLNRDDPGWSPVEAHCPCPSEGGGWCPHIVAVLLEAHTRPDDIVEDEALSVQIHALTDDQAKAVLQRLAQQTGLRHHIKAYLPVRRVNPPGALANDVKRHVVDAVRSLRGLRRSPAYGQVGDIISALRTHLDTAEELLQDGATPSARELLIALVEAYLEVWTELDDSDGEVSGSVDDVAPLLTESLLAEPVTEAERVALLPRARQWEGEAQDYGVDSLGAVVQLLEGGSARVDTIVAETHQALNDTERLMAEAWLAILFRRQSADQYLQYSEQTGYHAEHAAYLVMTGQIDAGIRYGHDHVLDAPDGLIVLNIMPAHSPSRAKPGGGQAGGGLRAALRGFSVVPWAST